MNKTAALKKVSPSYKTEVLTDYKLANISRNTSVLGRKEVLTGKAKFGIFGDGKEIAQIAFAKNFREGDWRSGYYRDQTFMMAAGLFDAEKFFAQLYGDTNIEHNPDNAGRSFNNHFATRSLNPDGTWKTLSAMKNTSSDISPTAGQMPRLIGLGYASKLFRNNRELHQFKELTNKGNEVAFGTIGDSSAAEGHFFEAMNAAGVLQIPVAMAVWDDGYGISVPTKYQVTKGNISDLLKGFEKYNGTNGIIIYKGKGWDYPGLVKMFREGVEICRKEHVPVLFHIDEMTQTLGHSTSGSHERYKSPERLAWEKEHDPIKKMREWILEQDIASEQELDKIEEEAVKEAKDSRNRAWKKYLAPILEERSKLINIIQGKTCVCSGNKEDKINEYLNALAGLPHPMRRDNFSTAKKILRYVCNDCAKRGQLKESLAEWLKHNYEESYHKYNNQLYNEYPTSALNVKPVNPVYSENSPVVNGREVLRDNFDYLFSKYPKLVTFGEDTGKIGGVNQSLEGLQKKYGEYRITDTGIRETTIIGQGIGLALRGLRPIAEIQYFDYLLYGLQTLSDDVATLHWRTRGGQSVPLIIRTRGHRFEGIWHAGSPMSMVINSMRGMHVCVPRDMTRAAGFYNTLLESDDPALVIEPLNRYRLKEQRPDNIGEFKTPLGIPEILQEGTDLTLVTYGSCVRIAQEAADQLKDFNISVELIDVQTLLPFDIYQTIAKSVKKTRKVLFFDEDVPGGASAYMMQKVIEEQKAYYYLDIEPKTLAAAEHRPAYNSDGDYFSNPNAEDVFEAVYDMMHVYDPVKYPVIY